MEKSKREHILVGLSSSPTNSKIIITASKMAKAFGGVFTAIYVKKAKNSNLDEEDKERLNQNMMLAEKMGATIVSVFGDDVATQISEYAKISGVTKIVIGRNTLKKRILFPKKTLSDKLIALVPDVDIHIIPDIENEIINKEKKDKANINRKSILKDVLISVFDLLVVTGISFIFDLLNFKDSTIITIYILGVLITSVLTINKICWGMYAVVSLLAFNFFFTEPKFTFYASDTGYIVTFLVMFIASFISGSLASKLKLQVKQSTERAYSTKIMFDTNKLLQSAQDEDEIIEIIANQIMKLLGRNVYVEIVKEKGEIETKFFYKDENKVILNDREKEAVKHSFEKLKKTGRSSDNYVDIDWGFYPLYLNGIKFGVIGIYLKNDNLDDYENNILSSIIGEAILSLANNRNRQEKEYSKLLAKNEMLKSTLLRSISHDLRTPLTTISGNANNLLTNSDILDEKIKKEIYKDIYDDSVWLTSVVLNILSITKLEDGIMNMNYSFELISEIISEAIRHMERRNIKNRIIFNDNTDLVFVHVDTKLIIQVIENIIDNAIKYSSPDSKIIIDTFKNNDFVTVQIKDYGIGISDEMKEHVFDMFYTGSSKIADSRRSLGLGLALSKSIINVHGGNIDVRDNEEGGTIFSFSLPISEVNINE